MAFNITELQGAINAHGGLSKASKFYVNITPPSSLSGLIDQSFWMLCESAMLPGLSIQADNFKQWGYGGSEKRPHEMNFQELQVNFFSGVDGVVFKFFHQWFQTIYNFDNSTNPNGEVNGLMINNWAYPNEYQGTVEIIHMDGVSDGYNSTTPASDEESTVIKYTLNKAFPISMTDIQVDWGLADQLVRIPVTFAYKNWSATTMAASDVTARSQSRMNSISTTQTRVDQEIEKVTSQVITNGISNNLNY